MSHLTTHMQSTTTHHTTPHDIIWRPIATLCIKRHGTSRRAHHNDALHERTPKLVHVPMLIQMRCGEWGYSVDAERSRGRNETRPDDDSVVPFVVHDTAS